MVIKECFDLAAERADFILVQDEFLRKTLQLARSRVRVHGFNTHL